MTSGFLVGWAGNIGGGTSCGRRGWLGACGTLLEMCRQQLAMGLWRSGERTGLEVGTWESSALRCQLNLCMRFGGRQESGVESCKTAFNRQKGKSGKGKITEAEGRVSRRGGGGGSSWNVKRCL